jgi:hypothetical protein
MALQTKYIHRNTYERKCPQNKGFGVQIVRDEQFCGANIIEVQISKK